MRFRFYNIKISVMKKSTVACLAILISITVTVSCSKSSPSNNNGGGGAQGRTFSCAGITPKFGADVQAIVTSLCATNSSCHASGSTNSGGAFTNYNEINAKSSNIRTAILSGSMPKTGAISQAQINAIICWIDNGAANN
jgi:hypothetical protein